MHALVIAGLGFALGLRHAADSDHVVAVTAIAARYKRVGPAALVGVLWGLGHTLTICLVGGAIILFNLVVPPRVGLALEFAVGIALLVVGLLNLTGHGGFAERAPRRRRPAAPPRLRAGPGPRPGGERGGGAPRARHGARPAAACAYLLVFGLGTILGMVLVTVAVTSPVAFFADRFRWSGAGLRVATGLLSVAFGVWVMVEAGFLGGLFGAVPRFTPY